MTLKIEHIVCFLLSSFPCLCIILSDETACTHHTFFLNGRLDFCIFSRQTARYHPLRCAALLYLLFFLFCTNWTYMDRKEEGKKERLLHSIPSVYHITVVEQLTD